MSNLSKGSENISLSTQTCCLFLSVRDTVQFKPEVEPLVSVSSCVMSEAEKNYKNHVNFQVVTDENYMPVSNLLMTVVR